MKRAIFCGLLFLGLNLFPGHILGGDKKILVKKKRSLRRVRKRQAGCCEWEKSFNSFVRDCIDINREVFTSTDTMKVFTWVLPVYLFARYIDETVHASFYEKAFHKNVPVMSDTLHDISNKGVTAVAIGLSLSPYLGIFKSVERTSSLLGKGVASISTIRTIIKYSIKARSALRPWNGNYSSTQRALGGFPSGHMAVAGYMATLYGLQNGARWGAPLAGLTAFSFLASIDSNRHYVSQLVGGLGIGFIYGWASHKVLESRHGKNVSVSLDVDTRGRPRLGVAYEF